MGVLAVVLTGTLEVFWVCLEIAWDLFILFIDLFCLAVLWTIEEICQGSIKCLKRWLHDV